MTAFAFLCSPLYFFCVFLLFAIKFRQKINRTYCTTATYSLSHIESQGESLHSAQKCCIFAPAIERTAFCALPGSSLKTYTGYKRWQAPVINEDPENGRNGAFWGVANTDTKHTTNDYD